MIKKILSFLVTFLIPFYLVRFNIVVPTTLFEIFILIIFIYLALFNFPQLYRRVRDIDSLILIGASLFFIGSLGGILFSPEKITMLGEVKGFIVIPVLAGLSLIMLERKNEIFAKYGFYLSAFLIGLESIYEYLVHIITSDGRVLGIYRLDAGASPNYLSLYLTPIAALLLYNLFKSKSHYKRVVGLIIFITLFISVFLSQSRAGVGVLVIVIIYECYLFARNNYNHIVVNTVTAILGLLVMTGIIFVSLPNFNGRSHYNRVSTSNNIRYIVWKTTVTEIIPEHWLLGVGLGNYQNVFKKTTLHRSNFDQYVSPLAVTPHNIFLSVWLDLGIIGLIGFLMMIIVFFKNNLLRNGWAISLLVIILLGLVDTPILKNDLGSYFWILILAGSYWSANKKEEV